MPNEIKTKEKKTLRGERAKLNNPVEAAKYVGDTKLRFERGSDING